MRSGAGGRRGRTSEEDDEEGEGQSEPPDEAAGVRRSQRLRIPSQLLMDPGRIIRTLNVFLVERIASFY